MNIRYWFGYTAVNRYLCIYPLYQKQYEKYNSCFISHFLLI